MIDSATRMLKVADQPRSAQMRNIAILALSKAVVDRTFSGYKNIDICLHIVFEATRQVDVPITKNEFQELSKTKIKAALLSSVINLFKSLGYKPRPINIEKIATKITQRRDFPIAVTSKYVELVKELSKTQFPARENPRVTLVACLFLAAEVSEYPMSIKRASRIVFHNVNARHSNAMRIKETIPMVREYLTGVYQWKQ